MSTLNHTKLHLYMEGDFRAWQISKRTCNLLTSLLLPVKLLVRKPQNEAAGSALAQRDCLSPSSLAASRPLQTSQLSIQLSWDILTPHSPGGRPAGWWSRTETRRSGRCCFPGRGQSWAPAAGTRRRRTRRGGCSLGPARPASAGSPHCHRSSSCKSQQH